jgi:hypothetical protein
MQSDLKKFFFKNKWGNDETETVSGAGSTVKYTENLRNELPKLWKKYDVRVFLDAPCGDFNWMKLVDTTEIVYCGMDIVEDIIRRNIERHGSYHKYFRTGDITEDSLPFADMMMCRDCLFHLRYSDAFRFLNNFVDAGIPFLLLTSNLNGHNRDIERPGLWRQLNMRRPPFNFPEPIEAIEDWIEGHPKRQMGLWSLEHVRQVLAAV